MRSFFSSIVCLLFISSAFGQKSDPRVSTPDPNKKIQIVETACGECQFKLSGKGCELAVRIDGKSYFVDGTDIDSHGDAHAKMAFVMLLEKQKFRAK